MQRYEKIAYYASFIYTLYHLLQLNVTYCQLCAVLFGNLEYFYYLCIMKEQQINSTSKPAMRAYGRMELASLYSPYTTPRHAWRKLQEWIESHPTLSHDLAETGYDGRQRTFTPAQVHLIFTAIGVP